MNSDNVNIALSPTTAIIVYTDRAKRQYYLEARDVNRSGDTYNFGAPSPLTDATLGKIARHYHKKKGLEMKHTALIPPHILHAGISNSRVLVMWYRPAHKRTLNFSSELGIKQAKVFNVPAILFAICDKSLYVYALAGNQRPTAKTKLYNAPFFNVYEGGNVCLGTAQVGKPGQTYEGEAQRFEAGFYLAEQNGGHHIAGLKTMWNTSAKTGKPIPSAKLKQHKVKTVGKLLEKLIGKNTTGYEEEIDN